MVSSPSSLEPPPSSAALSPPDTPWHGTAEAVCEALAVGPDGLDDATVQTRRNRFGPNTLREVETRSVGAILLDQVKSLVVALLFAAAVVSLFFGDIPETIAIGVVLLLNTAIGFFMEWRAVRSMEALHELADVPAVVRRNGTVQRVSAEALVPGDIVLLEEGDVVTADVRLVNTSKLQADESALTGESVPVDKATDPVPADAPLAERASMVFKGTSITRGSGEGVVVHTGMDTELGDISSLVEEAESAETPLEERLNALARSLVGVVLVLGAAVAGAGILAGRELQLMIETGIALAVAAIPEGLPIVATIALARGLRRMARRHALVRRLSSVETLGSTSVICTDKTGTLTEGRFGVTDTLSFSGMAEDEILAYAAAVESRSEHPIAQGIVEAVDDAPPVETFNSITGKGAEGRVGGRDVKIVSPGYLRENGYEITDPRYDKLSGQGKTVVFVLIDDALEGAVALADVIREESKEAVSTLRGMGIQVMMLTGDNRQVAEWVAGALDLDDYFAEVLPDEKADKVKEVQSRGLTTAMVGDGVNDAPALATADVGIAIGAGTDVAVEAADIVLVHNNPQDVTAILKLAQRTYSKMVQNLWWAAGYNIFAIPVAAGVLYGWGILFGPAVGAALMSLSTVIVAINARLLTVDRHMPAGSP